MKDDIYITGIGISAGGVEALKTFFDTLDTPVDTAFVIIQHLATHQQGYLKGVLQKTTDRQIFEVKNKIKLKKNNIYIIPPQYFLLLKDGHLIVKKRDPESKVNDAIDQFLTSLAEVAETKAVAIIMSGLGSDGSRGAQRVKEKGGVVMVQEPHSASFSNMPLSTILSDHPDVIGTPEELAQKLSNYIKTPAVINNDQINDDFSSQQKCIQEIIARLNKYSGVNFNDYKINTILRRIDKRIKINHLTTLEDYLNLLKKKPEETTNLFHDLLIGVTEFYRDSESFRTLSEVVIPIICKEHNAEQLLRIWVPGCSTGEEAYSIAMLLEEHIQQHHPQLDFKLFATDLNPKAIQIAGKGHYAEIMAAKVPDDLLKKYFIKTDGFYEVKKDLRKKIIFSVHNLLSDPPFIRVDLISCRNLFIYLKEDVQKRLLYTFNYSLNNNGYLMMGANETDGALNELFDKVNIRSKIFKNKISTKRPRNGNTFSFDYEKFIPRQYLVPQKSTPMVQREYDAYAEVLVQKYAPTCLLISENNDVVYTSGETERYVKFPNDRVNLNIFDMVKGGVSLAIRTGLRRVREEKIDVTIKHVEINNGQEADWVDLRFSRNGINKIIILEFSGIGTAIPDQNTLEVSLKDSMNEIEQLEVELQHSRKELQYNSDQLEAINEELQSSNEEMKSSNEELQTTNEELQSTNEELQTVNMELQHKIDEVTTLHNDMNNLFVSTQIATIFLDRNLKIRKYTPAIQRYFNIRQSDIGRPIDHYTYNFTYKTFKSSIKKVLSTLEPVKKEVLENNGDYSMMQILPYKTDDMRIDGVIVTFVDITELKESNLNLTKRSEDLKKRTNDLELSQKYWKSFVDNSPDIIARLDQDQKITFINESIQTMTGRAPDTFLGKEFLCLSGDDEAENKIIADKLQEAYKKKIPVDFYQSLAFKKNTKFFYFTFLPELDLKNNDLMSILVIIRDISDLREAEIEVEEKNRKLLEVNDYMDSFVHAVAHDLRSPMTNLKLILELIEDEQNQKKKDALINKFGSSVNRIDNILNGLIEIIDTQVKISEKAKNIKLSTITHQILEQVVESMENVKVTENFEVEIIRHIRGYIYSILRNLISNAVKYRSNNRPLNIDISTKQNGSYVQLSVKDNGIGMNLDLIEKDLFKPFKRFNTQTDGKGIGLHIIKSMVEKTGGYIEVESRQDQGSTFHVFLKSLDVKEKVL